MKLTKEHFQDAADRIRKGGYSEDEQQVLRAFLADYFQTWNPQFDRQRFLKACMQVDFRKAAANDTE